MYYLKSMRLILVIATIILFSACTTKYTGSHTNLKKFNKDINYCLKKSCLNKTKNLLNTMSIISSALAYGGGGGGSGGGSFQQNKISYKVFNLCLKEKGYFKDENGIFELPHLSCN